MDEAKKERCKGLVFKAMNVKGAVVIQEDTENSCPGCFYCEAMREMLFDCVGAGIVLIQGQQVGKTGRWPGWLTKLARDIQPGQRFAVTVQTNPVAVEFVRVSTGPAVIPEKIKKEVDE